MATILIIDDDVDMRAILGLVLLGAGHETFAAASGSAGARIFHDQRPDLVITDMIMPEADGIEAIGAILAIDPAARILAISGVSFGGNEYYLKLAMQFGAMAVLPKPFRADQLLSAVASCLTATPT